MSSLGSGRLLLRRVRPGDWKRGLATQQLSLAGGEVPGAVFPRSGDRVLLLVRSRLVGIGVVRGLGFTLGGPLRRVSLRLEVGVPYSRGLVDHGLDTQAPQLSAVPPELGQRAARELRELSETESVTWGAWLPGRREDQQVDAMPEWAPTSLTEFLGTGGLRGYAYVSVDEMIGDTVALVIAEWPRLDTFGRLRFADAETGKITLGGLPLAEFTELLDSQRAVALLIEPEHLEELPSAQIRQRPIEVGDVFAIPEVAFRSVTDGVISLAPDFGGDVFDISLEAREQAKAAQNSAQFGALPLERTPIERPEAEQDALEAESLNRLHWSGEAPRRRQAVLVTKEGLQRASELREMP